MAHKTKCFTFFFSCLSVFLKQNELQNGPEFLLTVKDVATKETVAKADETNVNFYEP